MKKLILLLLLLSSPAWAADWYVRPSSGEYGDEDGTSYAKAFDGFSDITWGGGGVSAGDTLYICGTHDSTLTLTDKHGTSGSRITITGNCPGDPGSIDLASAANNGIVGTYYDYITIEDLTVSNGLSHGVAAGDGCNNLIFNRVVSHSNGDNGFVLYNYDNNPIHDITLNSCIAYSNASAGFSIGPFAYNFTFNNCRSYQNAQTNAAHGYTSGSANQTYSSGWVNTSGTIYSKGSAYPVSLSITTIERVINATDGPYQLTQNTGTPTTPGSGEWGINGGTLYINIGADPNGKSIIASQNTCYNIVYNECFAYSMPKVGGAEGIGISLDDFTNNSTIKKCTIYSNEGPGITVNKGTGNKIIYNTLYSNGGGIAVYSNSYNIDVFNNTIYESTSSGIYVGSFADDVIAKNNIVSAGTGIGIESETSITNCVGNYNLSYGNSGDEWSGHASMHGANDVEADPLLTADYKIPQNSPAKDAGTPVFTYAEMAAMGLIVYGTSPDMGGSEKLQKRPGIICPEIPPLKPVFAALSTSSAAYVQPAAAKYLTIGGEYVVIDSEKVDIQ
jgi:parallel beta-helix repeat protein